MAPEAVNHLAYNEKVDIYSFGVILRLLLTGSADFPPPDGPTTFDCAAPMQILLGTHLLIVLYSFVTPSSVSLFYQINARPVTTIADPRVR